MKRLLLLLFLFSSIVHAQVGGKITQDPWVSNRQGYPAGGTSIAICQPITTTAATLTSSLAIFTVSSNPITAGFVQGMTIQVSGFTGADTYFNAGTLNDGFLTGGLTILSVSSTQIIASLIHANGTASTNGTILQFGNSATPCAGISTVYTDASLVTTETNPMVADGLGNYSAGAKPGTYYVQYYGSGVTTTMRQIIVPCSINMVATCGPSGGGGGGGGGTGTGIVADITTSPFNARAIVSNPSTTTSCTSGLNTFTFASAGTFKIGDGVTFYGCGTTNAMSTPNAPTVVPSVAAGETGTGWVVNSATGSSTYKYLIIARDKYGAVTAPSSATTITTGQASLGMQTSTITSLTRANDIVTVVTSANLLAALSAVQIESTASKAFNGFYTVGSVTNNTTFVLNGTPIDTRAQSWQTGDVASVGSGGRIAYYLSNHLSWTALTGAWEYYVCTERPGDTHYHLIGVTKPTNTTSGYQDVQFDDWGSPYMDSQTYPPYIELSTDTPNSQDAICTGSATNDPLTTTITGITGNNVTTTATSNQNTSGTTVLFDDGPAIIAAANSAVFGVGGGGPIYIPPAAGSGFYYPINSYTKLPNNLTIWDAGYLTFNETFEIDSGVNWLGDWGNFAFPQFGFNNGVGMQTTYANPAIFINGQANTLRALGIYTAGSITNGGVLIVADNPEGTNFNHDNFVTGNGGTSTSDYLSIPFVLRDTSGTIDNVVFDTVLFNTGPDQVSDKSWSPALFMAPGQNGSGGNQNINYSLTMNNSYWNRRGMDLQSVGGGGIFSFNNMYRQGGITPMFMFQSDNVCVACATFNFTNEAQDTEGEPVIANLYLAGNSDIPIGTTITFNSVTGANGNGPLISGTRSASFKTDGYFYSNALNIPNRDATIQGYGSTFTYAPYANALSYFPIAGSRQTFTEPVSIPSGHSLFFDMQPPSSVTSSAGAGGSVPTGTWYYAVNSTGADGGETILSIPATGLVVSGGNQTITVNWTNPVGAYTSNIYRCTVSCLASDGTANNNSGVWYRLAQHQTGASYIDTAASPTQVTIPQVTGTGVTLANSNGYFAKLFQCAETTAPSGIAGADILYCDSTAHRFSVINNNGTASGLATLADFASPPAIGNTAAAAGNFTTLGATGNITTNVTGGGTQCLHVSNTGVVSGLGADCGSSGATTAFSGLTSGTNTAMAAVLGTGSSLTISGSGTNNATTLLSNTWASPAAIGTGSAAAGTFTAITDTGIASGTQCIHANGAGLFSGTGSDCGSGSGTLAFPVTGTGIVSGAIPCGTSTTVLTMGAILNTNILTKGGGAGACPTNSSITDNGTTVSTSEPLSSGNASFGGGCSAAGSTASGGICDTESANTGWTPTSGQDYMRADSTLHAFICSINGGAEPGCTLGAPTTVNANALATTPSDSYEAYNNTLSTGGATLQYSPSVHWKGHVWNTTSVAADNAVDWLAYVVPQSGTSPVSFLEFYASLNGGAFAQAFNIASYGGANSKGAFTSNTYGTTTNCAGVGTGANPSIASCGSAAAGHFSCATNATGGTCTVNTTAVTANSEIFVFESDTAVTGTALSVTCNTGTNVLPTSRLLASSVAATSFTINLGTVTTNPACFSYNIVN